MLANPYFGFTSCSKAIKMILLWFHPIHWENLSIMLSYWVTHYPSCSYWVTQYSYNANEKCWRKQIYKLLCYMSNELRSRLVTRSSTSLFKIESSLCLQLWKVLLRCPILKIRRDFYKSLEGLESPLKGILHTFEKLFKALWNGLHERMQTFCSCETFLAPNTLPWTMAWGVDMSLRDAWNDTQTAATARVRWALKNLERTLKGPFKGLLRAV